MTKIEFNIDTIEKRSNWIFLAASKCNELGIDTANCGLFRINGKLHSFIFDSDLKITGIARTYDK